MSTSTSSLILSTQDYERLTKFLRLQGLTSIALLAEKLASAELVPQTQIPSDLVTMNSVIEFIDEGSGKAHAVTLVYPMSADPSENRISIMSPLGVEILGLRVGHTIAWPTPTGRTRTFRVGRLLFQPEAAGAWHL